MQKKGATNLSTLPTTVILLGVTVILGIVVTSVLMNLKDSQCTNGYNESGNCCYNASGVCVYDASDGDTWASNISGYGLDGVDEMGSQFDLLGMVIIFGIVIGVLIGAFMVYTR